MTTQSERIQAGQAAELELAVAGAAAEAARKEADAAEAKFRTTPTDKTGLAHMVAQQKLANAVSELVAARERLAPEIADAQRVGAEIQIEKLAATVDRSVLGQKELEIGDRMIAAVTTLTDSLAELVTMRETARATVATIAKIKEAHGIPAGEIELHPWSAVAESEQSMLERLRERIQSAVPHADGDRRLTNWI